MNGRAINIWHLRTFRAALGLLNQFIIGSAFHLSLELIAYRYTARARKPAAQNTQTSLKSSTNTKQAAQDNDYLKTSFKSKFICSYTFALVYFNKECFMVCSGTAQKQNGTKTKLHRNKTPQEQNRPGTKLHWHKIA